MHIKVNDKRARTYINRVSTRSNTAQSTCMGGTAYGDSESSAGKQSARTRRRPCPLAALET